MRRKLALELVLVGLVIAIGAVTWDLSYVLSREPADQHGEGAIMLHNTIATVVVALGVVLAAVGARWLFLEKPATREAYALFAASTLLFADGVLHFFVVSEHLSILPFAVFFVVAGGAQILLGFGLLKPRPLVFYLATITTIGLMGLFFLSRTIALPYSEGPEEYNAVGLLSKVLEGITLVALGVLVYRWRTTAKAEAPKAEP